jgi:autotransporter-associated beta strand protein
MCIPKIVLFLGIFLVGLPAHAITINGFTANASNRWAATPTDPITGPFSPNTNAAFVGLSHDFSGVGWQSSSTSYKDLSVTLVSPMHFAAGKHVGFGYTNSNYTFANTANTLVSRSIGPTLNKADIVFNGGPFPEVRVVRLDTGFTPSDQVKVYRLLDVGETTNIIGYPAVLLGHDGSSSNYQRRIALSSVTDVEITGSETIRFNSASGATNYAAAYVTGDSGSPSFIVYEGQLHFAGCHWFANLTDSNWMLPGIYPGVNAYLSADGYALRWTIDSSKAKNWNGNIDGTFGTLGNWLGGSGLPSATVSAAFDAAETANRSINLNAPATVRGIRVKAAAGTNPFTLTGSTLTLHESGLRNEDADTLTINNAITLGGSQNWEAANGPITLGGNIATAGFLVVLSGEQVITLTGNLTGNGSIAWDNPGTWTPATGQLALTTGKLFVQRGTVNLTSANTYSGGTVVTGGTLLANNPTGSATGTAPVTLANTARLGGSGTITGAVTFQNTSGLNAHLTTAAGSHDKLDISGVLALGTTSTITVTATAGATTGTYTLVTAAGGITGSLPTLNLPSGWSAIAQISGNNLNLIVTSLIPTAPVVAHAQRFAGPVNVAAGFQISASQSPTSYAITGGVLPTGLTLNTTTGLISGMPTQLGTFSLNVTATNGLGTSLAVAITLQIFPAVTSIVNEPFAYAIGTNNPDPDAGANGGNGLPAANVGGNPSGNSTGLRSNWGTTTDVSAGLIYSQGSKTLVSTGGAAVVNNADWGATTPIVYRNMTTDPWLAQRVGGVNTGNFGIPGTSLFMSFVGQTSSATADAFRLSLRHGASANFYLSNTATGWSLNGTPATGATLALNTPTLFVIRYDFGASTTTINLWVNPPLGQALGAPNASVSGVTFPGFSNFQTRAAVANAMTFDEIRLGTTLDSVTPFTELQVPPPSAPTALAASAVSASQIDLSWTDNASDESGFKLERSPDGTTGWTQISTPAANATSHSDTGLTLGTPYHYRLRATNTGGDSTYTATATATTWSTTEIWRNLWFGTIANSGSAAESADPDGDGVTNAQERTSTSDPLAPGAPAAANATTLPARLVTLAPVADAHTEANNPSNNYSTSDLLVRSEGNIREAFLKYDLAALTGTVERAQLVFWPTGGDSQTPTFNVQQILDAADSWTETGLNWNNKPGSTSANAVSFPGPVSAGIPRTLDVTAMVGDTLANDAAKQLGLRVFATGSMPTQASSFGSKENGGTYRYPYLHITLRTSAAAPVKIMHIGDSITRGGAGGIGSNTFSNGGSRYYLHNLLLAAGIDFRAVGPRTDGSIAAFRLATDGSTNSSLADRPLLFPDNAGYSGQSIEYIRDNVAAWLGTYSPDVMMLMIGTNNIGYTSSPSTATQTEIDNWKSRYTTLLSNILAASPSVKVIMATIPPAGRTFLACNTTRIEPFNAQVIQPLFAQYAAANPGRFFLVDNYAAITPSDISPDDVHPGSLGHQKLARSWHAGLMSALGRTEEARFVNEFTGADAPLRGGALAAFALGNATTPLAPGWTNALLRAKTDTNADNRAKALIKFDLSGLPTYVGSATIGFAYHGTTPLGALPAGETLLHLYGINDGADAWTKSSVTWNSAPGHDSSGNGVLPANAVYLGSTSVPAGARTGDLVTFQSTALREFLTWQSGGDDLTSFVVVASGRQSLEVVLHASNQADYQPPFLLVTANTASNYENWAAATISNPAQRSGSLAPAGDGVTNLQKFAFNMIGTGPGQSADVTTFNAATLQPTGSAGLPYGGLQTATNRLQITFIRRKAGSNPGITYAVEFSNDLSAGSWATNPSATESATSLDASLERVTVTDSTLFTKRFARVKVTAP